MTAPDIDPAAWARIAAERPFLLRLARAQLTCAADAEDVVQEALVSALLAWSTLRDTAALRSWLVGILRHKVTDLLRRRRLAPQAFPHMEGDGDDEPFDNAAAWHPAALAGMAGGEQQLMRRQLGRALEACAAELPSPAAQLLLLRELVGLEMEELPQDGTTQGAVRVRLHRARHRMRSCLLRSWGAPD